MISSSALKTSRRNGTETFCASKFFAFIAAHVHSGLVRAVLSSNPAPFAGSSPPGACGTEPSVKPPKEGTSLDTARPLEQWISTVPCLRTQTSSSHTLSLYCGVKVRRVIPVAGCCMLPRCLALSLCPKIPRCSKGVLCSPSLWYLFCLFYDFACQSQSFSLSISPRSHLKLSSLPS